MILRLSQRQAELILGQAAEAYPAEACGLLIGRRQDEARLVDEVRPCRNLLARELRDRFEIDPGERLEATRQARPLGREIVGHYHSHPDGQAVPSATDKSMMYEPELAWLIVSWPEGRMAAFRPSPEKEDFEPAELVIATDERQNPTS